MSVEGPIVIKPEVISIERGMVEIDSLGYFLKTVL